MTSHPRRAMALATATLAAATLATTTAPPAKAEYAQYTCKLPDGSPARTDGWVPDEAIAYFRLLDDCQAGGGISSTMSGDGLAANEIRHWHWQAPPNTTLAGLDLRRAFDLAGGDNRATPSMKVMLNSQFVEQNGTSVVSGNGIERLGDLADWRAPQNRILLTEAHSISGNGLVVGLGCLGSTGYSCPNTGSDASRLLVHSAAFTLSDLSAPSIHSVGGSLLTAVDRKVHSLTISASDLGGGVYRAIVEVDGGLFAAPVLDGNGGRCADAVPSTPEPYEFQHRVPCKLQVTDAQVPVDTRSLSEGPHTLRVWVEDAAGNRTSAAGPRTIGVADATGQQPSQHDVQQDTDQRDGEHSLQHGVDELQRPQRRTRRSGRQADRLALRLQAHDPRPLRPPRHLDG